MPTATVPATLATWEATITPAQRAAQAPHQAAVLAWLTALHQLLLSAPKLPGDLDMDDVHTVLRGADALRAVQTETTGPARAAEALQQVLSALPPSIAGRPARRALLSVASGTAAPLDMDELSEITETIHNVLLHQDGEMIFGHAERVIVVAGAVQVRLLLGY